jgi:hypothetical protein
MKMQYQPLFRKKKSDLGLVGVDAAPPPVEYGDREARAYVATRLHGTHPSYLSSGCSPTLVLSLLPVSVSVFRSIVAFCR